MPLIGQPSEWTQYPGSNIVRDITNSGHYVLSEQRGGTSNTSITGALLTYMPTTGDILINVGGVIVPQSFLNSLTSTILNNIITNEGDVMTRFSGQLTTANATYRNHGSPLVYQHLENNRLAFKNAWSPGEMCWEMRITKKMATPTSGNTLTGMYSLQGIEASGCLISGYILSDNIFNWAPNANFISDPTSGALAGLWTSSGHLSPRNEPKLTIAHQTQNIGTDSRIWLGFASNPLLLMTTTNPLSLGIKCAAIRFDSVIDNPSESIPGSGWVAVTCDGTTQQETVMTGIAVSNIERYLWHIDYDRLGQKVRFYGYHDDLLIEHGLLAVNTTGIPLAIADRLSIMALTQSKGAANRQMGISSITCTMPYKA